MIQRIQHGSRAAFKALVMILSFAAAGPGGGFDGAVAQEAPQMTVPNFAALAKRYGPAVVNISVTHEVQQLGVQLPPGVSPGNPLAPFLARRVLGNREEMSLGSGFIVSADGYILTNRHVVGDADTVDVKLTDKREFKGKVVGSDTLSDVALVKIDADALPVVVTGNPDRMEPGDWVMAIGAPYGFANTVTAGRCAWVGYGIPAGCSAPTCSRGTPSSR